MAGFLGHAQVVTEKNHGNRSADCKSIVPAAFTAYHFAPSGLRRAMQCRHSILDRGIDFMQQEVASHLLCGSLHG